MDSALAIGIEASAANTASALALLRGVILATALALVFAGWLALRRFRFMIANLDQSTGLYTLEECAPGSPAAPVMDNR